MALRQRPKVASWAALAEEASRTATPKAAAHGGRQPNAKRVDGAAKAPSKRAPPKRKVAAATRGTTKAEQRPTTRGTRKAEQRPTPASAGPTSGVAATEEEEEAPSPTPRRSPRHDQRLRHAHASRSDVGGGGGGASESGGQFVDATRQSPIYAQYYGAVRTQLQKIGFETTVLETYEREGWRSANLERMRPERELAKSRQRIRDAKRRIRELLKELMEGPDAQKERRLELDSDGGVDSTRICCAVCDHDESNDENDIILCDLEGCHRAFHQTCCDPPVSRAEMDLNEDWFCRRCMTLMECLNKVNEAMETDFDSWEEVFPPEQLAAEEAEDVRRNGAAGAPVRRSRRGRKIQAPATETRANWDTHSFASDTDDESFDSEAASKGDDSQSSDEDSDGDESSSALVLDYKRERKPVDYRALAKQMFGTSGEAGPGAQAAGGDEDEDEGIDCDFEDGKSGQLDLNASLRELL